MTVYVVSWMAPLKMPTITSIGSYVPESWIELAKTRHFTTKDKALSFKAELEKAAALLDMNVDPIISEILAD